MTISDEDFQAIQDTTDGLLATGLTVEQMALITRLIRLTYRQLHKSNKVVDEVNQLNNQLLSELTALFDLICQLKQRPNRRSL